MKVSILIPILKNHADFELTLASVLKWRPDQSHVIVTHDGFYHDPYDLSDEVEFRKLRFVNWSRWFANLLPMIDSDFVCTIQPGFEVNERWVELISKHFTSRSVVSVAPTISAENADIRGLTKHWNGQPKLCIAGAHRAIDSASRFAGWWRTDFLQQIVPKLAASHSNCLDLELGLLAKSLKLQTAVVNEPTIYCPSTTVQLQNKLNLTGFRAQQIMFRYGSGSFSTIAKSVAALFTEPLGGPQRLLDMVGRIAAVPGFSRQSHLVEDVLEHFEETSLNDDDGNFAENNGTISYPRAA